MTQGRTAFLFLNNRETTAQTDEAAFLGHAERPTPASEAQRQLNLAQPREAGVGGCATEPEPGVKPCV